MSVRRYRYIDDSRMVASLLTGDEAAVHYVFFDQFVPLLRLNARQAAPAVCYDDLVQELYLYISADNWSRLRSYNSSQPFINWFSVVSYRFFKDFSRRMIDSASQIPISTIEGHEITMVANRRDEIMMDIKRALCNLTPPRDRAIITELLINDEPPVEVAHRYGITVENLYNIKRRALSKLITKHLNDYLMK